MGAAALKSALSVHTAYALAVVGAIPAPDGSLLLWALAMSCFWIVAAALHSAGPSAAAAAGASASAIVLGGVAVAGGAGSGTLSSFSVGAMSGLAVVAVLLAGRAGVRLIVIGARLFIRIGRRVLDPSATWLPGRR